MTIKEVLSKCAGLKRYEVRAEGENYSEVVFFNAQLDQWTAMLAGALGPAHKKPGVRPIKECVELTKAHGGIRADQTLFKKKFGPTTIVAVFWPWQSAPYTTLKIFTIATRI